MISHIYIVVKYAVEKNPETLGFGNKNCSQHLFVMLTSGLGELILGIPASRKHQTWGRSRTLAG